MRTKEEIQESISKLDKTLKGARQTVTDLESELSNLKYKENLLKIVDTLDATLPGYGEFQILTGCRYNDADTNPWTNIKYYDSKVTIEYPDSVEFEKEFKELLKNISLNEFNFAN